MKPLKLTMSGLFREGWTEYPQFDQQPLLLLCGLWLKEAGFYVGARVRVDLLGEGRLVITLVEQGREDEEMQPVVWVPAEQIGKLEAACQREAAHA